MTMRNRDSRSAMESFNAINSFASLLPCISRARIRVSAVVLAVACVFTSACSSAISRTSTLEFTFNPSTSS